MPAQGPVPQLLVTDDVRDIRDTLAAFLRRNGYRTRVAASAAEARKVLAETTIHLVLLDIMMPGESGLSLCRDLVAAKGPPVILLTAMTAGSDIVTGLNTGADDYLPKPFDLDELEARVRALARRAGARAPADGDAGASVSLGSLRHDRHSGAIYCRDEVLDLAPRELALLQALMARPGHAVSKEHLFVKVFPGAEDVQYEAIEVVAYRLRKKLVHSGVMLVTLRGLGYLLKVAT